MDLSLKNKNALVCGSSKGIGKAAAIELAALGANVTLVARSGDILVDVKNELPREGKQKHDFLVADFTNPAELKKKVHMFGGSLPCNCYSYYFCIKSTDKANFIPLYFVCFPSTKL